MMIVMNEYDDDDDCRWKEEEDMIIKPFRKALHNTLLVVSSRPGGGKGYNPRYPQDGNTCDTIFYLLLNKFGGFLERQFILNDQMHVFLVIPTILEKF